MSSEALRTAAPGAYPMPGIYEFSAVHVNLSCVDEDARIHYTLDGSEPTTHSPVYRREEGLLCLKGEHGKEVHREVKANAVSDGKVPSAVMTFGYTFRCYPKGHYRYTMLRERNEEQTALFRIEDYDLDKMYLLVGTKQALLIDAGYDETGDLPSLCMELTGGLLPDLIVTHGHPDHIMQARNFLNAGATVYLPKADLEAANRFGTPFTEEEITDVKEGDVFDLGNAVLTVYTLPGHTQGGIVLVDEKNGDLFSSDECGNNRRYLPDSAWLQLEENTTAEDVLNALLRFRTQTKGTLKRIFTGHNDEILDAELYLDTLEAALKAAVETGDAVLRPSLRSAAESYGSGSCAGVGDWRYDPYWIDVNLRFLTNADRDADPPRYAKGFRPGVNSFE